MAPHDLSEPHITRARRSSWVDIIPPTTKRIDMDGSYRAWDTAIRSGPTHLGLSPLFWKSMENTKTEAAALTVAHDSAVAHEAAGTGSPPVTGGMAAPPIPRASGLANEFPSSKEKIKTEAAALTVVHDYAVAHEAAGTGSPGTAPVTDGMAALPIPRASGFVNEFPKPEGEVYINAEPDASAIPECSSVGGTRGFYYDGEVYVDTVSLTSSP
ncbi:hypothetical protein B0H14DRAFT_3502734 [Mycena olivaceomarginata]|nr:hypothetical protein B0H14DRAFT_3502734 [Mycena olivaceomarginata]